MNKVLIVVGFVFLIACNNNNRTLPVLGEPKMKDGKEVPHYIPDFEFLNQDSVLITNEDLDDYVYIADFFFTSCPSICPKVTTEMLRIHDKYKGKIKLVSYTMDPKRDTPSKLADYAERIEVSSDDWLFLTGDKKDLHNIATDYFSVVIEDGDAPGGFNHTGKILLVDKDRHIRSFCEGTDEEDVDKLIKDIKTLLNEYEK